MNTQTAKIDEFNPEPGEMVSNLPAIFTGANTSLAVSLARAEIDQQIATSRAMPRSIKRAVDNILTLATLDNETAEECVYALPRGGKPIKGPSVRLAEIVASQYGNCRVGARIVHVDRFEKYVEAEGAFHDLETNTATTARVRRRISDKRGRVLNDDMIIVTGNAACAIAKRNAVLGGVPKAVWRRAYKAVESVLAGDLKTLVERRAQAMKAFAAFGITPEQIFTALDVAGIDDIGLEHMTTLIGMHSALKNGEATVEEMFPKQQQEDRPRKTLDSFASGASEDHDPETGEVRESLQGSDSVQRTADENPAPAARSDSRPAPEGGRESGGKRQASEPSESGGDPSTTVAGAKNDLRLSEETESELLRKDDLALTAAAKRGSRALDEAIIAISESRRSMHEAAIERRHRPAAHKADASN